MTNKAIDIHTHFGPWRLSDIVKYQFNGEFYKYFDMANEVGIEKTVIFKVKEGDNKSVLDYVKKNN